MKCITYNIVDFRQKMIEYYFDEPYDDPGVIELPIIKHEQNAMPAKGGHSSGATSDAFEINFADDLITVSGWNPCEIGHRGGYRWMTVHVAELALFLPGDRDFEITVDLGTQGNCQDQHVTFAVAGDKIAECKVSNLQSTVMSFILQRERLHFPVTLLKIRAAKLARFEGCEAELSLRFARVSVHRLAVNAQLAP